MVRKTKCHLLDSKLHFNITHTGFDCFYFVCTTSFSLIAVFTVLASLSEVLMAVEKSPWFRVNVLQYIPCCCKGLATDYAEQEAKCLKTAIQKRKVMKSHDVTRLAGSIT